MTTDPKHQRLKDRVVEATINWRATITNNATDLGDIDNAQFEMEKAVDALRAYEARSSTSEAVCEPPEEHREHNYHWLKRADRDGAIIVRWMNAEQVWLFEGLATRWSRRDLASKGYSYLAPCIPPSQDTEVEMPDPDGYAIEIGDADIHRLWVDHGAKHVTLQGDGQLYEISAHKARLLTRKIMDSAGRSAKAHLSDEYILGLAAEHSNYRAPDMDGEVFSDRRIVEFARAILSKSPPSISDQTLLALRSIALTRDQDVYLTDARMVVRAGS